MDTLLTWDSLTTYGGAALVTALAVHGLRYIPLLQRIPGRLLAYVVSLVILVAAQTVMHGFHVRAVLLCLINALVVSFSANGGYDAVCRLTGYPGAGDLKDPGTGGEG